ncbi:Bifunctional enzyme IspD/IspF [Sporomusa acidovorans DSM 3132]|uniref:Bifunctional enzyme IspD/IspF n=1 Tax=Sporomusa acidovorans (strain ATCC 49682 / DSM 3132 / Mol) TaxID=1123286 RepID=A0ABZ3IX25_SPOA4|nr:2-C-methyl-D-erythritol 4-phosphate cytidylyltransferase [Sporomusa acidovorans]OZC13879.1 bifunctional enzyme IspD/IspF [Sporomusa acidovorans DSM 3132]SDF48699.1 2-C-methyl-D-erythritol 2,4-cyclodiphosphate synthase [Sporomusa acidovorans]
MVCVIIAAAGQGKRMGSTVNKVLLPLAGKPVLAHTIQAVCQAKAVTSIILTAAAEETEKMSMLLAELNLSIPWQVVPGGSERQYSIANALQALPPSAKIVAVHDGARPLAGPGLFDQVIEAARLYQAAVAAVPVKDTIKITDHSGWVTDTPERSTLWSVQTPQAFDRQLLASAYELAAKEGYLGTDDASLVERLGARVKVVAGSYQNMKLTTPEDLHFAETVLAKRQAAKPVIRAGIGYDVHRLVPERRLILGGVAVPYELGLAGHSDADVLLHAVKDALLGAAGLGDIGKHFPDTDERYKGISSMKLLAEVHKLLNNHGYIVNNIDATIVAQKPKLAAYIAQMNSNIAAALDIDVTQVNVKATTTEGLGFAGQGEGVAAYATATIASVQA